MLKTLKNKLFIIALIIMLIFMNSSFVMAASFNPDDYNPGSANNFQNFLQRANKILGVIQFIGILVAAVAMAAIGLKFIFGSIEEKAEYKKTFFPYIVGCILIVLIPTILKLVATIAIE